MLEREVVPGLVGEGAGAEGRVENCVVLGLGSLTGGDGREHSWWQLVALETILEVLRRGILLWGGGIQGRWLI